ncbi:MAG: hypothetical protein K2O30_07925 [Duncaniella sp.]|nr:hypothetical protein [Duncaniella sp.]MDE7146058.1 hypothetical protein [Duncaniella sp.]
MVKHGNIFTILLGWMIFAAVLCVSAVSGYAQSHKAPHYVAEREISFEMNSATGFVRIPAEYVWVKYYHLGEYDTNVIKSRINVGDNNYRFTANINDLKTLCGSGARRLPLKSKIIDRRSKKEKSFHITRLLIRFRENGNADVQVDGYIFDK